MTTEITSRVHSIAKAVSRRTHEDVEDLIQEGMLAAWLAIPRFNGMGTLGGWCSIRARGAMIDYLRRCDHITRIHRQECKSGKSILPVVLSLDSLSPAIKRKI